jgi:hypothetical protein
LHIRALSIIIVSKKSGKPIFLMLQRGAFMSTKPFEWDDKTTTKTALELYSGDNTELKAIAEKLGTSVPSLRSKLVSAKVYVAAVKKKTTDGKAKSTKAESVKAIETLLSVTIGGLISLEKSTAKDLKTLTDALIRASAARNAELGEEE